MAEVGTAPPVNSRQALQDGLWLRALANGQNRSFQTGFTAKAGGTKAAAIQLPAAVAMLDLSTVATNGDSALMPQAASGTVVLVTNSGAADASLYGRGTDTINGAATANAYTLASGVSALFFCITGGAWFAIKSA